MVRDIYCMHFCIESQSDPLPALIYRTTCYVSMAFMLCSQRLSMCVAVAL